MKLRLGFRYDRVQGNNGIVQVFLTHVSGPKSQDQTVIFNILKEHGEWQDGKYYLIEAQEYFPHLI
jgi:hypothetical protein